MLTHIFIYKGGMISFIDTRLNISFFLFAAFIPSPILVCVFCTSGREKAGGCRSPSTNGSQGLVLVLGVKQGETYTCLVEAHFPTPAFELCVGDDWLMWLQANSYGENQWQPSCCVYGPSVAFRSLSFLRDLYLCFDVPKAHLKNH